MTRVFLPFPFRNFKWPMFTGTGIQIVNISSLIFCRTFYKIPIISVFCSFSLILYEIHGRRGPYGDSHGLKTHEILKLVCSEIFRPPVDDLENCMDFVKVCLKDAWDEEPALRPDFKV